MRMLIPLFTFLCFVATSFSQSEKEAVIKPLNDYMIGTSYNYPEQIKRAFHDTSFLYLTRKANSWIISPEDYSTGFGRRAPGVFNGREAKLTRLDIYQDVAYAEIEIVIRSINARFIDLILLKRFGEEWKIISKTATRFPLVLEYTGPRRETVFEGLRKPWSMAFISEEEALVAEKDGDLLRINLTSKSKTTIEGFPSDLFTPLALDVSKYPKGSYPKDADGRTVRFNAGILEVLLDPDFKENSLVYVSYVSQKGDQYALKVIRGKLVNNRLTEIKRLLNPGPYKAGLFHFGGGMTFGADGLLYITAGERLFYEYEKEGLAIAQDVTDARGKIYRIHPDGSIPLDNPDFGSKAVPGIFALGIRAAQGITLEPGTNKLWFSEHGTIQGDEVNLLEAGANYGWPNVTSGKYRSPNYEPEAIDNAAFTEPIHYWLQTVAPTGLTFYTGNHFPEWQGNLIVPGLSRGSLWRIVLEGEKVKTVEELFMDDHVRLRKAVMSPNGGLYLLTDEENGRILKVTR
ncbi:MAG: PQQ-dependent sugar dehydrogenase [Saprospiraceae bacterium]|nr:PQQ-dependent sugar dehydrogenase [Saprospiraceae bacterium]